MARTFACLVCGMRITASLQQAKRHGWALWVGGARCRACCIVDPRTRGALVTAAPAPALPRAHCPISHCPICMQERSVEDVREEVDTSIREVGPTDDPPPIVRDLCGPHAWEVALW